jgi:hypothetical protein
VAVDGSGNIYVAGSISGTGTYTFGAKSVAGTSKKGNFLVVKYNSSGDAQWASTNTSSNLYADYAEAGTGFGPAVVDASGNVYVAGAIVGAGTYTFGTQTVAGQGNNYSSTAVIVKYNSSSGAALWAQSATTTATTQVGSIFGGLAVDASGYVYAAGHADVASNTYLFGTQSVTGSGGLLVKYDSAGTAKWAKTASGISSSYVAALLSVATDSSGNIYVAGMINGSFAYGTDIVTSPSAASFAVVLAKYASNGTVQWARTASACLIYSIFAGITVDPSGNAYAVGQVGNGTTTFGTWSVSPPSGYGAVIVKYDTSGTARWAHTVVAGTSNSMFNAIALDASAHAYAVGYISGTSTFTFGTQNVTGASASFNPVIVQYKQ